MAFVLMCSAFLLAAPTVSPDFDTDILPVLSKAGCNAAACHGAAAGRGGFKLSLFGGDPAWDYDEIAHRLEGRRINLAQPDHSLLLLKPTEHLAHEGGLRFESDSAAATVLTDWIRSGAHRATSRRLVSLDVTPSNVVVEKVPAQVALHATATFEQRGDSSETRDVTALAIYAPADSAAVETDSRGVLTIRRPGRHVIAVRFLSQVKIVQVTVPLADAAVDVSDVPRRNWIDDEVLLTLQALRLPPAREADDATLLRRVTLDLTGRLPAPEMVREYVANRDAEKYEQLVDRLLHSSEAVEFWTYRFARLLRIRTVPNDEQGTRAFYGWLQEQVAAGTPWDDVARRLLTAAGDSHTAGPANFFRVTGDARSQAEYVSEALLGVRMRCANCHDHPLDQWTQDDYHGLAAIFARVEQGRVVRALPRGEVTHPRTGQTAVARIPGVRFLEPGADPRPAFADWLVSPENPYFAQALVNRLWKSLLGRGLVEPADDLRVTNPATHPALLDRLAKDFVQHGYNWQHTLRLVATSDTYRRSSQSTATNRADDRFFSHSQSRPLDAEVLMDAIRDVTGVRERPDGEAMSRAVALVDARQPDDSLDVLGRCARDDSCDTTNTRADGLTTQLHLLNGPLINAQLAAPNGRLRQMISAGRTNAEIVAEFYVRALARAPRAKEHEFWSAQLIGDENTRPQCLEDFLWSLLTCREFTANH